MDDRTPAGLVRMDLTLLERRAFYEDAARAAAFATHQIQRYASTNPALAADAAWAASDTLHLAARILRNPHLRRAADTYDRAARMPYGRVPAPTPAGNALRTAARLMAMAGIITDHDTLTALLAITALIQLADAIARLRAAQRYPAQAEAARTATGQLTDAEAALPADQINLGLTGFAPNGVRPNQVTPGGNSPGPDVAPDRPRPNRPHL